MTTDDPGPTPNGTLTLTEAAAYTGYSREALRQHVKRGSLPATKGNDGVLRVHRRDLADLPPPDATGVGQGQEDDATTALTLADLVATVVDLRADLERTRSTLDATQADRLVDQERAAQAETQAKATAVRADSAEAEQLAPQARLDQVERDRDQARQEREAARVQGATSEGEARALREALAEARRPALAALVGGALMALPTNLLTPATAQACRMRPQHEVSGWFGWWRTQTPSTRAR